MLKFLFTVVLTAVTSIAGQHKSSVLEVATGLDTTVKPVGEIVRLLDGYLTSEKSANISNPYWSTEEQAQLNPYDLVATTWWDVSLHRFIPIYRVQLLSITPLDSAYLLRTMLYTIDQRDSARLNILSIFVTGVRRENGQFKLCNALNLNTSNWNHYRVGWVSFYSPQSHQIDTILAQRMSRFVDSLNSTWGFDAKPIDYYFSEDPREVFSALGFDYWPGENHYSPSSRGFVDISNRKIYASSANEWYPHEFVHVLVNPHFPNIHPFFSEGYATLIAGAGGQSLEWHIRRNYEHLLEHPEAEVLKFKGVDPHVGPAYVVGGILCDLALRIGGVNSLKKLMSYGADEQDLYMAIEDIFMIKPTEVESFLRSKMADYARR